MPDAITGLKPQVFGAELKQLCEAQASFHEGRLSFWTQNYHDMVKLEEQLKAAHVPNVAQSTQGFYNTVESRVSGSEQAKQSMRKHENAVRQLTFMAAHVDFGASYILDDRDMMTLGIIR